MTTAIMEKEGPFVVQRKVENRWEFIAMTGENSGVPSMSAIQDVLTVAFGTYGIEVDDLRMVSANGAGAIYHFRQVDGGVAIVASPVLH